MKAPIMFRVTNDSMNNGLPNAIAQGTLIIAEKIKLDYWRSEIKRKPGLSCVIVHPDGVIISSISMVDSSEDLINCHALNPDYTDFKMSLQSVTDIHRITHFEGAGYKRLTRLL